MALEVVVMTTFGATSDDKFPNTTTLGSQQMMKPSVSLWTSSSYHPCSNGLWKDGAFIWTPCLLLSHNHYVVLMQRNMTHGSRAVNIETEMEMEMENENLVGSLMVWHRCIKHSSKHSFSLWLIHVRRLPLRLKINRLHGSHHKSKGQGFKDMLSYLVLV